MAGNIIIINGNPENGSNKLDTYLLNLEKLLVSRDISFKRYNLSDEDLYQCIGCWDCWWKTPGLCRFDDSMSIMLKNIINSMMVIYASPMSMGFYSSLLKRFHDRTIPLVHPYIEIIGGECHHKKRYPNYPKLGFIFDSEDSTSHEINVVKEITNRVALNFHSEVKLFCLLTQLSEKEAFNEISNI